MTITLGLFGNRQWHNSLIIGGNEMICFDAHQLGIGVYKSLEQRFSIKWCPIKSFTSKSTSCWTSIQLISTKINQQSCFAFYGYYLHFELSAHFHHHLFFVFLEWNMIQFICFSIHCLSIWNCWINLLSIA